MEGTAVTRLYPLEEAFIEAFTGLTLEDLHSILEVAQSVDDVSKEEREAIAKLNTLVVRLLTRWET